MSLSNRVWKKIHGWQGKLLPKAGKEVLIRVVAQAIPNYTMSVFQLPVGTFAEINRCVARFWLGKLGGKGIHWRKWDKLCVPKKEGGLEFRELSMFNQALVTRQEWRLLFYPQSLVARMLKAKYSVVQFYGCWRAGDSYLWKSFLWGRELLRKGLRWRVSNGRQIRVFRDR